MTLEELKTEISAHKDYKDLTDAQWDAKSTYRGLHRRSQVDFDWLQKLYPKKIEAIREELKGELKADERAYLVAKEERLFDKLACVIEEQRLRKDNIVVRPGTHESADYYIDYVGGLDTNDGLSTGAAYKTITKYTTTEVRVPADRAFLRANITWLQGTEAVNIIFDEDGSIDSYIEIIGCDSVTNDPWSDSSDVKPIIDFESTAYYVYVSGDDYWQFTRLKFANAGAGSGAVSTTAVKDVRFISCDWDGGNGTTVEGVTIGSIAHLDSCTFANASGVAVYVNGYAFLKDCVVDAGVSGATYGLYINSGEVEMSGGSIGATYSFGSADIYFRYKGSLKLRNAGYDSTKVLWYYGGQGTLLSEDDNTTFESQRWMERMGTITRDTGTVRGGGADSSAKLIPNAECGPNQPLIFGDKMSGFAKIWATASTAITISVYVRVGTAWDFPLTASECYIRTSHLSNGATAARTEGDSTETIDNAGAWTALTRTITPARTGFVYVWFYLAEYEDATEHVFVDIKPVVS